MDTHRPYLSPSAVVLSVSGSDATRSISYDFSRLDVVSPAGHKFRPDLKARKLPLLGRQIAEVEDVTVGTARNLNPHTIS